MQYNDPFFSNVPDIGSLKVRKILVEDYYIVLSILEDDIGNTYLCHCCDTRDEQRWNLVSITPLDLIRLLFSEIGVKESLLKSFFKMCIKLNYETRELSFTEVKNFDELDIPRTEVHLHLFSEDDNDDDDDEYTEIK